MNLTGDVPTAGNQTDTPDNLVIAAITLTLIVAVSGSRETKTELPSVSYMPCFCYHNGSWSSVRFARKHAKLLYNSLN